MLRYYDASRRGQATFYMILGILALIVMSLFLYQKLSDDESTISKHSFPDFKPAEIYFESCLRLVAHDALVMVGQQGGYIEVPTPLRTRNTSYWYVDEVNVAPFISDIEQEVNNYILEKSWVCSDYTKMKEYGYNMTVFDIKSVTTKVLDKAVSVDITFPVDISMGNSVKRLNDFSFDFNIRLMDMYKVASELVNRATVQTFDRCGEVCENNLDVHISTSQFEGDVLVVGETIEIIDDDTNKPYHLSFAINKPLSDAFDGSNDSLRLAILAPVDADPEFPSFGDMAIKHFNEVIPFENHSVEVFDCGGLKDFFDRKDQFDVAIITGHMHFYIGAQDTGCYNMEEEFNDDFRDWVNSGKVLWINYDCGIDNFVNLMYRRTVLAGLQDSMSDTYSATSEDYTVLANPNHKILTCPHNITQQIANVGHSGMGRISVNPSTDLICGTIDDAKLWTEKLGNGMVVWDTFFMKDNLYANVPVQNDIQTVFGMYAENVLNYLVTSRMEWTVTEGMMPILIEPINGYKMTNNPKFYFDYDSKEEDNESYILQIRFRDNGSLIYEENPVELFYIEGKGFEVSPFTEAIWNTIINLEGDNEFEWQVAAIVNGTYYWSSIDNSDPVSCVGTSCVYTTRNQLMEELSRT
ncbi:hypothetical protein K9M79_00005 [Candidatus Woesearchaeota archaeon]|nr:hypothetical protein [Candidatus Woesearchaeota archaeon]